MEYDANTVFWELLRIVDTSQGLCCQCHRLQSTYSTWSCTEQSVHSSLGMYVCTYIPTYRQLVILYSELWQSYGRQPAGGPFNVLDNQCSLTCIQNHGTRKILVYFFFLSLTTIKLYSCWQFPKQLNTLTLGGIYIHGSVHNELFTAVLGCIYKLVVPWPVHLIKAVPWEITNNAVDTNV